MKNNVLLLLTFLLPFFSFQLNSQVFRFDLESPNIPDAIFKVVVYPKLVQISDGDELIGSFSYNSFCATQNGVILAEGGDKGFLSSAEEQFILDVAEGKYGHSISFYKGFPVGYAMITEGKDFAIACIPTNPDKFNNELNSLTEYILKNNKQTTPSATKIEPYQSTAVRDIRNKNDLNFEVNGVKFTMIEVEGGTFTMGDNSNRVGEQYANNKPAHNVTLSSFYIAQTEVTQELWHAVMGKWPESYKGPKYPVNDVSWDDCQKFIKKLNSITGKKFRLPTEAEWEFAARGGNMSKGYKYAGSNTINDVSWYSTNSLYGTHEVATKKPNELGIYDMSGNSIEWCQDWYDYNYYKSSPSINPIGPKSGKQRVLRGGGWKQDDRATCLSRYFDSPKRDVFKGFRLAIGKDN